MWAPLRARLPSMAICLKRRLDAIPAIAARLVIGCDIIPPPAAASRCGLVCGGDQCLLLLHEGMGIGAPVWAPLRARLPSMAIFLERRLDAIPAIAARLVTGCDIIPPPAAASRCGVVCGGDQCLLPLHEGMGIGAPMWAPLRARLPSMAICLQRRLDAIPAIAARLVIGCDIIPPPAAASRCGLVCGGDQCLLLLHEGMGIGTSLWAPLRARLPSMAICLKRRLD